MKLIELDMSKSDKCTHPDVKVGLWYLVKINGKYWAGKFSQQHFGLNFYPWYAPGGIQFDAPGTNASEWQGIWEIVEGGIDVSEMLRYLVKWSEARHSKDVKKALQRWSEFIEWLDKGGMDG